MELKNKTILLTGASSGIGKEIAKKLSLIDCNLILIARRENLIDEYLSKLSNKRAEILTISCDVSSKKEVKESIEKINKDIDIAILNAGVDVAVTPENFDSKYAEKIFGTNVFGIIYLVEQLLPHFIEKRNGMIVGVSSLADNRGFSGSGFYCASKAAVTVFLEGLRVELKPYNIKVITVKPGFVKTPMTDKNKFEMPFIMKAERAANIIIRGIEKGKRVIEFPLPTVIASKLIGLLPGNIYEVLANKTKL